MDRVGIRDRVPRVDHGKLSDYRLVEPSAAAAYARDRRIGMPLLMGLNDVVAGKGTIESTIKKLIAMEAGRESDFTIDHTQERLPLVRLAPRGGEGKDR